MFFEFYYKSDAVVQCRTNRHFSSFSKNFASFTFVSFFFVSQTQRNFYTERMTSREKIFSTDSTTMIQRYIVRAMTLEWKLIFKIYEMKEKVKICFFKNLKAGPVIAQLRSIVAQFLLQGAFAPSSKSSPSKNRSDIKDSLDTHKRNISYNNIYIRVYKISDVVSLWHEKGNLHNTVRSTKIP